MERVSSVDCTQCHKISGKKAQIHRRFGSKARKLYTKEVSYKRERMKIPCERMMSE
jgi:hypothetical protein